MLFRSPDPVLAAIAAKAVIEMTYHRDYAAGWVVRLGDGTELSHERMQSAIEWTWSGLPQLLDEADEPERAQFWAVLREVLASAHLRQPAAVSEDRQGTRAARSEHSDELAALLTDLQSFARADPEATW